MEEQALYVIFFCVLFMPVGSENGWIYTRLKRQVRDAVSNETTLQPVIKDSGEISTNLSSNGTISEVVDSGVNTGVINGSVIAALVMLLVIVAVVLRCSKHKRKKRRVKKTSEPAEKESLNGVE